MKVSLRLPFGLAFLLLALPTKAQDHIKVSGLAYIDYSYTLASPDEDEVGENGFGYRRLYLTTDYTLNDTFSGRVRFEASDKTTTTDGKPAAFVKDLYVRWKGVLGDGHDLTVGVNSPPAFTVSERFWGYRSLEKTILDRNKILSSRDMGVVLKGPVTADGLIKYGLMFGNNSSGKAESDRQKRLYGQLEFYPADAFQLTIEGDYADYDDSRDKGFNTTLFAGYRADAFRLGVEGFFNQISLQNDDTADKTGVAVFAAFALTDAWEAVARVDFVEEDIAGATADETFFLAGVAYSPHAKVEVIPNVMVSKDGDADDAHVTGRLTLHVSF